MCCRSTAKLLLRLQERLSVSSGKYSKTFSWINPLWKTYLMESKSAALIVALSTLQVKVSIGRIVHLWSFLYGFFFMHVLLYSFISFRAFPWLWRKTSFELIVESGQRRLRTTCMVFIMKNLRTGMDWDWIMALDYLTHTSPPTYQGLKYKV